LANVKSKKLADRKAGYARLLEQKALADAAAASAAAAASSSAASAPAVTGASGNVRAHIASFSWCVCLRALPTLPQPPLHSVQSEALAFLSSLSFGAGGRQKLSAAAAAVPVSASVSASGAAPARSDKSSFIINFSSSDEDDDDPIAGSAVPAAIPPFHQLPLRIRLPPRPLPLPHRPSSQP
jgi:hypothetical protein